MTIEATAAPVRPPNLATLIASRLRAVRKDKGRTLQEIAKALNTTPQTIQRLETANQTLSLEWLEAFCKVYEISPADLFADGTGVLATKLRAVIRLIHAHDPSILPKVISFLECAK